MNLTQRLASRNLRAVSPASMIEDAESAAAQFSLECAQLENDCAAYMRVSTAMEAIEVLSERFFADRMVSDERHVDLYRLSVESVFKAADLPFEFDFSMPAFENRHSTYSTEAEKKVGNIFQRVWAWLMAQLRKIGSAIQNVLQRFTGLGTKGEERIKDLKAKAGEFFSKEESGDKAAAAKDVTPKASTEAYSKEGTVAVKNGMLIQGAAPAERLNEAQSMTKSAGKAVLDCVRNTMKLLTNYVPKEGVAFSKYFADELMTACGMQGEKASREIPVGHGVTIQMATDIGVNKSIRMRVTLKFKDREAADLPRLNKQEVETTLDLLEKGYKSQETLKAPMSTAAKMFSDIANTMEDKFEAAKAAVSKATGDKEKHSSATAADAYRMLGMFVSQLAQLPTNVLSGYLQTQWAIESYVKASIDA